jgi:DNA-3-methyladenine glycosylase
MYLQPLPKSFYERDPADVAQQILCKTLVRKINRRILAGRIVETEAYYGISDPASRAFGGKITSLNKWMYSDAGTVFVYMVHGNWLFNIITSAVNKPAGILIRAVEPTKGLKYMLQNRPVSNIINLTSGPGKLTKAFGITNLHTGLNVSDINSEIVVIDEPTQKKFKIFSSHRIGVKKDLKKNLRFFVSSEFVSKKS